MDVTVKQRNFKLFFTATVHVPLFSLWWKSRKFRETNYLKAFLIGLRHGQVISTHYIKHHQVFWYIFHVMWCNKNLSIHIGYYIVKWTMPMPNTEHKAHTYPLFFTVLISFSTVITRWSFRNH